MTATVEAPMPDGPRPSTYTSQFLAVPGQDTASFSQENQPPHYRAAIQVLKTTPFGREGFQCTDAEEVSLDENGMTMGYIFKRAADDKIVKVEICMRLGELTKATYTILKD